jgi:hypothetical protein
VQLAQVAVAAREVHQIHQRVVVQAEIIFPAELNFRAPFPCPEFVARDDDKVHFSLFISKILGPLDIDISLHVANTGVTSAVISFGLAKGKKGENHNQCGCDHDESFHLHSPSTLQ